MIVQCSSLQAIWKKSFQHYLNFLIGGRGSGRMHTIGNAPEVDWICLESACGTSNFARNKECQQCSASRPTQIAPRHGDWNCSNSSCGVMNFARRSVCYKCQAPHTIKGQIGGSVVRNEAGKKGDKNYHFNFFDCYYNSFF